MGDIMKKLILKRIGAYLIDFIIVTLIISIITIKFTTNNKIIDKLNELVVSVNNNEITMQEYSDKMLNLNYEYKKSTITLTVVNVLVNFSYFIIFATLNKGQTFGKMIFKIKVVNKKGNEPCILNMFIRSIFLYGILMGIVSIIGVKVFNAKTFNYVDTTFDYINNLFIIVCFFMVIKRKDGRGLHDMMAGTSVIGEEK